MPFQEIIRFSHKSAALLVVFLLVEVFSQTGLCDQAATPEGEAALRIMEYEKAFRIDTGKEPSFDSLRGALGDPRPYVVVTAINLLQFKYAAEKSFRSAIDACVASNSNPQVQFRCAEAQYAVDQEAGITTWLALLADEQTPLDYKMSTLDRLYDLAVSPKSVSAEVLIAQGLISAKTLDRNQAKEFCVKHAKQLDVKEIEKHLLNASSAAPEIWASVKDSMTQSGRSQ